MIFSLGLSAQGWEQSYGGNAYDAASDLLPTSDGGFYVLGSSASYGVGDRDFLLIKTGPNGEEEWSKTIGDTAWTEHASSIQYTSDGNLIIGGTAEKGVKSKVQIIKTDLLGNVLWSHRSLTQDSVTGQSVIELASGGYLVAGNRSVRKSDGNDIYYTDSDVYLVKFSATGVELNDNWYGGHFPEEGFTVLQQNAGTVVIAGYTRSFGVGGYDAYLLEIDTQNDSLNLLQERSFGTVNQELGHAAAKTNDGGYVITGMQNIGDASHENFFLLKLDSNLDQQWLQSYPATGYERGRAVTQTLSGEYLIAGNARNTGTYRQALIVKTDTFGNQLWSQDFGGQLGDGAVSIENCPNAGFALAGYTFSYGAGSSDAYLIKSDSSGTSFSNLIYGNVYTDFNLNCDHDNGDLGIPQWTLSAKGNITRHTLTDSAGNYQMHVDSGTYEVQVYPTSSYWEPCEEIVEVAFNSPLGFDSINVEFPIQPEINCPLLSVNISTPFLRRCFPNIYTLEYCNSGTEIAENAYVDVSFDSHFQIDTASVPYTASGTTYTFQLGDVGLFECGTIKIYTFLDSACTTTYLGQSHCVEAHIYPDSICQPIDPNWDGSSVEIDAICDGDSIEFTLTNVGQGDMLDVHDYVIIEDYIITFAGSFHLFSLQDTTITVATSGGSFRMEAEQSQGHPGESEPSISVEGCGVAPFSTGFLTQLPQNDGNPFIDIDCQESIGSFDPNDKEAFPKGFNDHHYIEPNTDLEYLIRFQNTGTDTAFRVIIRDTLSYALDITSIQAGSGSHPYTFEIYDERILKFTFDNIHLPDSNVNELESHGFIKFKVAQVLDNPNGTNIYNKAGIYFDYNEPVITNETYHLVGENFIESIIDGITELSPKIKYYPNPFTDYITFEFEDLEMSFAQPINFRLYDLQGRLLRKESFQGHSFTFFRKNLAGGLYLFRIENKEGLISNGKIVIGR